MKIVFIEIAGNPEELDMLVRVVAEYCREHCLESICDRERAASLIRHLFESGCRTADELEQVLGITLWPTRH